MLWGDPHIYVFDGQVHLRMVDAGDYWIVRSDCVSIQARYGTGNQGAPGVIQALAVGGGFLQHHVLRVEPDGGRVTWDGEAILEAFPSSHVVEGLLVARYTGEGEHVDPGLGALPLKSIEAALPFGVRLTVNRWPDHLDVLVTMRQLPGGQDGHCGNFNGNPADDTEQLIRERPAGARVFEEDTLLAAPMTGAPEAPAGQVALSDCAPDVRARAEELCRRWETLEVGAVRRDYLQDCIFDVCFGGEQFAREDAIIEEQMLQRAMAAQHGECSCTPTTELATTTTPGVPELPPPTTPTPPISSTTEPSTSTITRTPRTNTGTRTTTITTTVTTTAMTKTSTTRTMTITPTVTTTVTTTTMTKTSTTRTTTITPTVTTKVTTTTMTKTSTTRTTATATTVTTTVATTTMTKTSTTRTTATATTTTLGKEITCAVWGDPHVVTFDLFDLFGSDWDDNKEWRKDHQGDWTIGRYFIPDVYVADDFWIVKSERISIQGRYGTKEQDGWPLVSIGVSGDFLQGHTLTVERMWDGAADVFWDGVQVKHPNAKPFWGLVQFFLKRDDDDALLSADIDMPEGVSLKLRRYIWNTDKRSATVACTIKMHKQPGGQDGHCGKADGDLRDDTTEYINSRLLKVPDSEILFMQPRMGKTALLQRRDHTAGEGGCTPQRSAEYEAVCADRLMRANLPGGIAAHMVRGCAVDVCNAGGNPEAAGAAIAVGEDVKEFSESCTEGCHASAGSQISWATQPHLCLHVGGGQTMNGSSIELWPCDEAPENRHFLLPQGREGQIHWATHRNMCLDIGSGLAENGARVQVWECTDRETNMEFILPEGDQGQIRWAAHPNFCLDVADGRDTVGTRIQLWECTEESRLNKEFVIADGSQ